MKFLVKKEFFYITLSKLEEILKKYIYFFRIEKTVQTVFSRRKIYLEVYLAKNDFIGFCVCEILFEFYRHQITNFYFYPSTDVTWLIFLELQEKKYVITPEVSKMLITLESILKDLNFLSRREKGKLKNEKQQEVLQKYKNIKIIGTI